MNWGGERGGNSLPASIRGCRSYGYEVNWLIGKWISDLTAPLATIREGKKPALEIGWPGLINLYIAVFNLPRCVRQ